jgi:DNA-binding NarL/FixJ family response regulator
MKLILVDDNLNFLEVLKFFVEYKLGHQVIGEAHNGEEFILLQNIVEADVILMDLIMKKMDGFEAAKRASVIYPDLKMVAMTMNTEKAVQERLKETGFRGVVSKNEIFVLLDNVLEAVVSGGYVFRGSAKDSSLSTD